MAYKRRFSDDDARLMEQDADAAGRITAAERKMALAGNSFNNRNNQIADLTTAAHERRMASRSRFIEGNPGAVSPQERAGVMQWQHNQGLTGRESALQQHEMDMLKQRGENDKDVAFERRMGMENQGLGVGRLKHGYTDEDGNYHEGSEERIARQQGKNALDLAEKEWAGKKEIADIGLKQHELEWGNGGGRERIARIEGGSRVDAARAQAEAAAEQQAQKNALEEQKIVSTIQRAAIQSQGKIDAAKIGAYSKEVSAALQAGGMNGKDTATVLAELREAHKDDPGWNAVLDSLGGGKQQGDEAWPGYTAEKTAELKKRGYTLVNGKPVKNG